MVAGRGYVVRGYEGQPWWLLILRKINIVIIGITGAFVLYTRSSGALYVSIGATLCSLVVKALKRVIRQPRPLLRSGKKKVTYGMPSTHSASIAFFTTYICLSCAYLPSHPSLPSGQAIRILPPILSLPCAVVIAGSRIWLGKHTLTQVAVGCGCGVIFAATWFYLWTHGLNDYGRQLEDLLQQHTYMIR
ncbi:PAP2-domain-containing protein [Neolentinus lepideus HHB14362 ss-1]|uniref:PAP2-domain-containing protein n=1 Tax=Neolentinus lepideus HHB14362 ss-1 TaxID=1314782 RepID=A0A165W9L5_9AGAM|nr:PAP2-domain-containing protein [Neolentinus lepideus HHB14362 ss-1]